jgi:nitroreductase
MVYNIIRTKRAVRNFTDKDVPGAIIEQILDAGRLAQSSKNVQPWHFIDPAFENGVHLRWAPPTAVVSPGDV